MSYRINQEKLVSLDSSEGVSTVEAVLIVSSSSVLPAYNSIPGRVLVSARDRQQSYRQRRYFIK